MINKKGWIRIIEAFVAILLVAGVVLVVVGRGNFQREDISQIFHDAEFSILREIQLNDTLREEILGTSGTIEWKDFPSQAPKTRGKIESRIPSYLECSANICWPSDPCFLAEEQERDVYAESVIITSNLQTFNPRLLKLFCWGK